MIFIIILNMNEIINHLKVGETYLIFPADREKTTDIKVYKVVCIELRETYALFVMPEFEDAEVYVWLPNKLLKKQDSVQGPIIFEPNHLGSKAEKYKTITNLFKRTAEHTDLYKSLYNPPADEKLYIPIGYVICKNLEDGIKEYEEFLRYSIEKWKEKLTVEQKDLEHYDSVYQQQIEWLKNTYL